jgi:hypothetical protein
LIRRFAALAAGVNPDLAAAKEHSVLCAPEAGEVECDAAAGAARASVPSSEPMRRGRAGFSPGRTPLRVGDAMSSIAGEGDPYGARGGERDRARALLRRSGGRISRQRPLRGEEVQGSRGMLRRRLRAAGEVCDTGGDHGRRSSLDVGRAISRTDLDEGLR